MNTNLNNVYIADAYYRLSKKMEIRPKVIVL